MIITLKDRQHWIDLCAQRIKEVEDKRKASDLEYEKRWRKRSWPFKDRPDTEFPSKEDIWNPVYPSRLGWRTLYTAENLKKILEDPHTHDIKLSFDEYEAICGW